jgi:hypothetical protein
VALDSSSSSNCAAVGGWALLKDTVKGGVSYAALMRETLRKLPSSITIALSVFDKVVVPRACLARPLHRVRLFFFPTPSRFVCIDHNPMKVSRMQAGSSPLEARPLP